MKNESEKKSPALSRFGHAFASWMYSFDTNRRRTQAGLKKKSIQAGSHIIAYVEGGNGETVLLLHGIGMDKDNWVRFARYLKKMYHVIAPDLPGFGESSVVLSEGYDIESQVKRIHEFILKVGLTKFHLAGNSMGGLIAGIYAADHPDEILSLGLIDPGGVMDREPSPIALEVAKGNNPLVPTQPSDFDVLLKFVFVKPPFIPGIVKLYLGEQAAARKDFNQRVFIEAKPEDQLERRMKDIRAKTLIIWGDTDRVFPVSGAPLLNKGIAASKLVIMKDCGHVPMFERPEETAGYYLEFIR